MVDLDSLRLSRRKGKFLYLFVALLAFVFVYPFFELGAPRTGFLIVVSLSISAAGVYAVSENLRYFAIAAVLGVLSLLGGLENKAGVDILPGVVLGLVFALVFYVFVVTLEHSWRRFHPGGKLSAVRR